MENSVYTWVNGSEQSQVSIFDRGLAFADGLFETLRVDHGRIVLLEWHLQRLLSGARQLGILLDRAEVEADIKLALSVIRDEHPVWRLKYQITRGESTSGYQITDPVVPNRLMQLSPFQRDVARLQREGVAVRYCAWRLSEQPALAGIKSLNRLDQVMARREWQDSHIFEGLMADQQGRWIEGTMTNLFAVSAEGQVITPALQQAGVAGVMRRCVIEQLCSQAEITVSQAYLGELESYNEVFVTNALIGIVPVVKLADCTFSVGPVTRKLQQLQQSLFKVE